MNYLPKRGGMAPSADGPNHAWRLASSEYIETWPIMALSQEPRKLSHGSLTASRTGVSELLMFRNVGFAWETIMRASEHAPYLDQRNI